MIPIALVMRLAERSPLRVGFFIQKLTKISEFKLSSNPFQPNRGIRKLRMEADAKPAIEIEHPINITDASRSTPRSKRRLVGVEYAGDCGASYGFIFWRVIRGFGV